MKSFAWLLVCLLVTAALAEPRRKTGGSSRKSSSPSRRTSTSSQSNGGLASLSYPGYNAAAVPKKQSQPSAPKQDNIGWNAPKKDSQPSQSHAYPASSGQSGTGSHAYPASGGLSGTGSHAYPASSGQSGTGAHAYPASSGQSGTGAHAYPASSGQSGTGAHAYPASSGQSGTGAHAYPASSGLSGTGKGSQPNSNIAPSHSQPVNNPPPYSSVNQHGSYAGAPPAYQPHPQGAVGGYNQPHYGGYQQPGYGGGYQQPFGGGGYHQPGYGGGYGGGFPGYGGGGFGGFGMNPNSYHKKSSFLSGGTFGAILAGLAVWNLARSGSHKTTNNHYYYGNNNTNPGAPAAGYIPNEKDIAEEPILQHLANCTLTITSGEKHDVTLIPCIIVSSFASDEETIRSLNKAAQEDTSGLNCMITLVFKNDTEMKVNMPCAELSKNAPKEDPNRPLQGPLQTNCTPGIITEELQPGDPAICRTAPGPNPVEVPLSVIPLTSTTNAAEASTAAAASSTTTTESTTTLTNTASPEETTTGVTAAAN